MSRDRAAKRVKPVTRGKCFTVTENGKCEGDEATGENTLIMLQCKKVQRKEVSVQWRPV